MLLVVVVGCGCGCGVGGCCGCGCCCLRYCCLFISFWMAYCLGENLIYTPANVLHSHVFILCLHVCWIQDNALGLLIWVMFDQDCPMVNHHHHSPPLLPSKSKLRPNYRQPSGSSIRTPVKDLTPPEN